MGSAKAHRLWRFAVLSLLVSAIFVLPFIYRARRANSEAQEIDDPEENVKAREEAFYFQRAYPFGVIPPDARRKAWESRPGKQQEHTEGALAPSWQSIGPVGSFTDHPNSWGLLSGRINTIAISPANPQTILVGGAAGGIWRSSDGGAHFVAVSDNLPDVAAKSIAFAPSNSQVVYAGMSDESAFLYLGHGVMKSIDGGQTWSQASNNTFPAQSFVAKISVDSNDASRVYAAVYGFRDSSFQNCCETGGIYLSTDGGTNWSRVLIGTATDMTISPANSQILYAACNGVVLNSQFLSGVRMIRSTDAGASWSSVNQSPAATDSEGYVTISPVNSQRVYMFSGDSNNVRLGVSTDGGTSWNTHTLTDVDKRQFAYNSYIIADPSDPNTVYIGAPDIFRSSDGGNSFTNITGNFGPAPSFSNYTPDSSTTHPDQHALAFLPGSPAIIFVGNDGGLFKSTNSGASFQSLNATLSLTQFHGYAIDPSDATLSYGGTQDNGNQRRPGGSGSWLGLTGGDGGISVVDTLDPSIVFTTLSPKASNVVMQRWINHGANTDPTFDQFFSMAHFGNDSRVSFTPAFTGNGVDSSLYFGTYRLWVSTDRGNNWTAPGGTTDLTKGTTSAGPDSLFRNGIGVARSGYSSSQVIYTGSGQGRAMVTINGGQTWTDVTAGLPNRSITSVRVDRNNPAIAYVTFSGFLTGHVFKTINTGANWTDITGNLPDIGANDLLIDPLNPNTLYVGTDIGVFKSTAGGNTWSTFNDGMPPVVVTQFASQSNGLIQVATYGRGAYELRSAATTVQFSAANYNVGEGDGTVTVTVTRSGDTSGASSVDYATADGVATQTRDYEIASGTLSFAAGETSRTFSLLIEDDIYVESNETFNLSLINVNGATLGIPNSAIVTIIDNDAVTPTTNPLDNADERFFVRQQYYDFLSRVPDQPGWDYWSGQITQCGNDIACIRTRRVEVSNAFFYELEFQQTGAYVYRLYRAAFGNNQPFPNPNPNSQFPNEEKKMPSYANFAADRAHVIGGANAAQAQLDFANTLVGRPEFLARYAVSLDGPGFVDALTAAIKNDIVNQNGEPVDLISQRSALINLYNQAGGGNAGRGNVIYRIADDNVQTNPINNRPFIDAEYNRAFVFTEYAGYLRRDSDIGGFVFWLNQVNRGALRDGNTQHAMVCSFITSAEYQLRFSPIVTHSNTECQQ